MPHCFTGRGSLVAARESVPRDTDVCLWTISEAARATGLSREMIRRAISLWEASRGAFGLAFVRCSNSDRQRVRKSQVLDWIERMERSAAHRA